MSGLNEPTAFEGELTPRQIVGELDRYIVGQHEAKKSVSIALRNRARRKMLDPEMREEIAPKNIIMIGPTGVGKTEIARRLSKLVNAPFVKVEITKYTEVGYMGRDVESMIRDLTSVAVSIVKKEHSLRVREKAAMNAEDRILDILAPENPFDPEDIKTLGFTLTGEDQLRRMESKAERTRLERERKREDLRAGRLDEVEIEYEAPSAVSVPMMSVIGGAGLEDMDLHLQNMLGDILPKKQKVRKLPVGEARGLFFDEEIEKLIDMDKVVNQAVSRAEETGIVFIDEIDKIAGAEAKSGPDVSRHGVQRDLLPVIEGTSVNTKYGPVKTSHVLFIAAGAFNLSKPSDLIPEMQGRFPIRVELSSLGEDDFRKILTVPKNSLTRQYIELLGTEGVRLEFTDDAIDEIARTATRLNDEHENIGARRLHTIMEKLLEEVLFTAPELSGRERNITIDAEYVRGRLENTVKNRDLSRYIL